MLTDIDGHGDQLVRVGADNLLHHARQVVVLRLPDDLEQLERDLPDLGLQVLAGPLTLAGQHHLDSYGRFNLHSMDKDC